MTEATDIHREIGSLLTQVEVLNREVKELKGDVKQFRDDFAALKGGGRVMMGLAAICGSGITYVVSHFIGKH